AGEFTEAFRHCENIEHGGATFQLVPARLLDFSDDGHLEAVHLAHDHRYLRRRHIFGQLFEEHTAELVRRQPRRLDVVDQWERDLPVRAEGNRPADGAFVPYRDVEHILGPDAVLTALLAPNRMVAVGHRVYRRLLLSQGFRFGGGAQGRPRHVV